MRNTQPSAVSGQQPAPAQFQGGNYNSMARTLRVDLGNVAPAEAGLIMALLALWTDPAHAHDLAALKLGCRLVSLEDAKLTLKSPQVICAAQPN